MNRILSTIYSHFRLGRPYYVVPVAATALAGYCVGAGVQRLWATASLIGLVYLLLGMCCWAVNEITDQHSDSLGKTKMKWGLYVSGGTGLINSGLLSANSALVYAAILAATGSIMAIFFGLAFWGLSMLFLLIGMAYSVKPLRLKERGVFGLAAVATACGVVAFSSGWFASGQSLNSIGVLFGGIVSVAFFGFDGIAHLLDHRQDCRNRENTFVVSIGREAAQYILATCQILPAVAVLLMSFFYKSVIPEVNLIGLIPLAFVSAIFAFLTVRCHNKSVLASLRVLSVPLISVLVFTFA